MFGLMRDSETFAGMPLSSYMVSNTGPSVTLKGMEACRETLLDIFNVSSSCLKHLFEKKLF